MDARLGLRVSLATLALLAWPSAAAAAGPVADFTVDPNPPNQGAPATYEVILQGDGVDSTVEWDFNGDGVYEETGPSVEHVHKAAGPTEVSMRATDEGEATDVTKTIEVNARPDVTFGFSPAAPQPGQSILFAANATDPEGDPLTSYSWSFGDGATHQGSGATHAYATPGRRTVTLTVTDARGAVGSVSLPVDVRPPRGSAFQPGSDTDDDQLAFITPFPIVRLAGEVDGRITRVRVLSVQAPRGTLVRVRCRGASCPKHTARRRVKKSGRVRFRVFERSLRAGTRLRIFVRHGDEIGKFTRFVLRRGKRPARTDLCLAPGAAKPSSCPS